MLPHSFVDFSAFVNKFAVALSFSLDPVAYVVVSIRVNVPAKTMIDVIFELALINNMVDFFANSLDSTITANLTYQKFVV